MTLSNRNLRLSHKADQIKHNTITHVICLAGIQQFLNIQEGAVSSDMKTSTVSMGPAKLEIVYSISSFYTALFEQIRIILLIVVM